MFHHISYFISPLNEFQQLPRLHLQEILRPVSNNPDIDKVTGSIRNSTHTLYVLLQRPKWPPQRVWQAKQAKAEALEKLLKLKPSTQLEGELEIGIDR